MAELKHAAVIQGMERQIQEELGRTPSNAASKPSCELSPLDFEAMRNGPRPTIMLELDVADILFGKPGDETSLAKKIKNINRVIEEILGEYLTVNGFYSRLPSTKILLLFREMTRTLAELKCNAIANEIFRRLNSKGGSDNPAVAPATQRRARSRPVPKPKRSAGSTGSWTQAVADATKNRSAFGLDEARVMPAGWTSSYQPLWRVRNCLLTACVLRSFPPDAEKILEPKMDSPLKEAVVRTDQPGPADLPVLDLAGRDICRTMNQGRQAIVIVPVRFATLDRSKLRMLYLHICSQLPADARKYLVPEIVGVPADLAPFRLTDRINQLRPFSRTILVRASLADRQLRRLAGLGLHAVGIDLSQYRGPETSIMQGLEQFAEAAEGAKLHTYAYGIPTLRLTTATVVSGIDYIGGDSIAPPVRQPLRVAEFDTAMLFGEESSPADPETP